MSIIPNGLLDSIKCKKNKWIIVGIMITKGKIKCIEKIVLKLTLKLSTEKPV